MSAKPPQACIRLSFRRDVDMTEPRAAEGSSICLLFLLANPLLGFLDGGLVGLWLRSG